LTGEAKDLSEIANEEARDEITDHTVYKRLADSEKKPEFKAVYSKLAETEYRHYSFWKKFATRSDLSADGWKLFVVLFIRRLMGATFAARYLEKNEVSTIKKYQAMTDTIPAEDRAAFEAMISDEKEHEDTLMTQVQGSYIKYISFIVLGLADALVEIGGIHAGSLGLYNSTELTGLAGIVAGAAASIAMASAAFAQAKQGFQGSTTLAAAYTGISYFVAAIILATPYFLTKSMTVAISTSLIFAVLIILFISYYNSVISSSKFMRDFAELTGVMFGATAGLYFFGFVIRSLLGISI
jgi:VIT1/CCC1 family predicted Fe2+/Mn2+ transporter